jgi:hypothetical protein
MIDRSAIEISKHVAKAAELIHQIISLAAQERRPQSRDIEKHTT